MEKRRSTDLKPLLVFYASGRAEDDFDFGIEKALSHAGISRFPLPRGAGSGGAAPGRVYRISDFELASRLSFFLWSSIPDDQLLDLAEQGKLKDPVILQQQVHRMLDDPRSQSLVE